MYMEKIKITEEQYQKLMEMEEVPCEDNKEELLESVEKTNGNFEVRNLIKEGEFIKGEVKSSYGVWSLMEWNVDGSPIGIDNKYTQLIYTLSLDESK